MVSRARFATHLLLLLVALLPVAGAVAGLAGCAEDCETDCRADCGDCILCCPTAQRTATASLAPSLPGTSRFAVVSVLAVAYDSRAIDHVPLRLA